MKRMVYTLSIITCIMLTVSSCSNKKKDLTGLVRHEKYVDVGTHKIRMVISDLPSDYTIVLESGGGRFSDVYDCIQDTLAKLTDYRVISYDRSGFGKSELGPANLTALGEVEILRKCLDSLKLKKKFILVGHSYGGFLIQLFTKEYPDLVKGLVLIDPMNVSFVDRFGLDSLNALQPYFKNPTETWQKAGNRMVDNFPFALDRLRGYKLPPDIPALLITSGNAPFDSGLWRKCHEEMVMNSATHKLIIAEGNGHDIMTENPQLVLNTIIELVNTIRSK
jgi:pimeloyl-ACP methyl ester carboxylesterase